MILFAKGLAFGFVLAAAVGPMWVLCLRRTLAFGPFAGLVSGLGIAVADAFYGAVAAFGLTAVSGFLLAQKFWLALAGGGGAPVEPGGARAHLGRRPGLPQRGDRLRRLRLRARAARAAGDHARREMREPAPRRAFW